MTDTQQPGFSGVWRWMVPLLVLGGCGRGPAPPVPAAGSPTGVPPAGAATPENKPGGDISPSLAANRGTKDGAANRDESLPIKWAASSRFKFSIFSDISMTSPDGNKTVLDTNTALDYTWRRHDKQQDLLFHSLAVEVNQDRVQTMLSKESRSHFHHTQGDETIDLDYDEANPELQQILHDSFEVVLLNADVDPDGRVLNETVVAGPHAQAMLDNGVLVNARLFQAPYYSKSASWIAPCKFTMGGGQFATGELMYQRVADKSGGSSSNASLHRVNVAGEAKGAGKLASGAEIQEGAYRVTGWQIFDETAGDWHDGKWQVDVSFDVLLQGKKISSARGTMRLALERVDDTASDEDETNGTDLVGRK